MPSTGLRPLSASTLALSAALLAACSSADTTESPSATTKTTAVAAESDVAAPRLVLTYDGGLLVLDATTLEVVVDIALDGFNRVNPAGDDRHVLVSHTDGFRVLDTGVWSDSHGDHSHHYAGPPALTDVAFVSAEEGHVVAHDGTTALFFDGTGRPGHQLHVPLTGSRTRRQRPWCSATMACCTSSIQPMAPRPRASPSSRRGPSPTSGSSRDRRCLSSVRNRDEIT